MGGNAGSRPDPDQLLDQIRTGELGFRRGRLRIYFGASAGVGKTFAMLNAAQRERAAGGDVLAGIIETHGRRETADLLAGLPQLPPLHVPYRGRTLTEFDLDAALARKPNVLLVDELAHSNVEGSRHPKRWQDVQELLEAGIDVWSSLNVRHLESLNGTVGAITGIRVHETVPDTVLDDADEIILVDVTPDELLNRLKEGKVYLPQQAERAAQNFFRKGNLIALREIALRRTAEHVEDDVRSYRVEKSISPVWNTEGSILACVGPREGAEQTVRTAARLAGQLNVRWHAAGLRFQARLSSSRERRAQGLFELTRELSGALLSSQVAEFGQDAVRRNVGGEALVLVSDPQDQLTQPAQPPPDFDASVADWVFRNVQPAGLATSTLAAYTWHYMPLKAPMRLRGVLALRPAKPRWLLIPEQLQQLETLARQIAIALERVHFVEVAQQAVVEVESERLRNRLLAAISHDVRTPLTALFGLADSLQHMQPPLTKAQADTARAIAEQAREINALVNNLLDMARLQSGSVNLRLQWQSFEEIAGSAIRAAQHVLGNCRVETVLPPDLPLVEFDAVLIERVLVNLLENAAKYAKPPVVIEAQATDEALVITVRDYGPGLPDRVKGREQTLFEKFTRGEVESATAGVGLGLAICKAVVDAHRGQISAANASGGGAQFTIRLPRRPPPPEVVAVDG